MQIRLDNRRCLTIGNKDVSILIEPDEKTILQHAKQPRQMVVLHTSMRDLDPVYQHNEKCHVFARPGEYEVGGIAIRSFSQPLNGSVGLIYQLTVEGVRLLTLPDKVLEPESELLEELVPSDVLLLRLFNGNQSISSMYAKWVKALNCRLVVVATDAASSANSVEWSTAFAINTLEPVTELKLTKKEVPDKAQFIWLQPST